MPERPADGDEHAGHECVHEQIISDLILFNFRLDVKTFFAIMPTMKINPLIETEDILRHWREAVPNDRLAHLVRDVNRALTRALQMRLATFDVPIGHWIFLRILWESDGMTQMALSLRAGVMAPTTTAAVRAMEQAGYVTRRHLPTNQKNVHVYLTTKGRNLKKKLVPCAEEINSIITQKITADDLRTTRKVLITILGSLAEDDTLRNAASKSGDAATSPKAAKSKTALPVSQAASHAGTQKRAVRAPSPKSDTQIFAKPAKSTKAATVAGTPQRAKSGARGRTNRTNSSASQ